MPCETESSYRRRILPQERRPYFHTSIARRDPIEVKITEQLLCLQTVNASSIAKDDIQDAVRVAIDETKRRFGDQLGKAARPQHFDVEVIVEMRRFGMLLNHQQTEHHDDQR